MRPKTSVYIATSLDGFIARTDGSLDWLEIDTGGDDYGFKAFMESIDSMVLGRATFQQVLGFGEWPYAGKHVVVPSSSLTSDDVPEHLRPEVEITNGEPAELLDLLETGGYKHSWVDGGKTIQRFLRDRLIDEVTISTIPVLIGEGIPLFGALETDINLKHLSTQAFDSGLVQSTYEVER